MKIDPTKTNDCNPNLQWVTRHGVSGWEVKPKVGNALNPLPTPSSQACAVKVAKVPKVAKVTAAEVRRVLVHRDLGDISVYKLPPLRGQSAKLKIAQSVRQLQRAAFRAAKTERLRETLAKKLRANAKEIHKLRESFWEAR